MDILYLNLILTSIYYVAQLAIELYKIRNNIKTTAESLED